MNTLTEKFEKEQKEFLNFLKGKFNLFHQSNVFFRDIHYGVMAYLEMKNLRTPYARAEQLTREIVTGLQQKGIFHAIDHQTFTLIYPEFKKPPVKVAPAAPAKPAVAAPAAAKPAPSAAPGTVSAVGPA
jgi:hypothetical protein